MLDEAGGYIRPIHADPVPFLFCDKKYQVRNGILADIAPTILDVLELKNPKR